MTTNISETVFDELKKDIFNGQYGQGSRLPSERELSERFNASRTSIRDALSHLEHLGLVQKIPQSGSYVTDFKNEAALPLLVHYINNSFDLNVEELSSFMDFRLVCEIFAVKKAVSKVKDKDITNLNTILDKKIKNLDTPEFLAESDFDFHGYIFRIADSLAIQLFYNTLRPFFTSYLNFFYKLEDVEPKHVIDSQRNLVTAIKNRDVELSAYIMEKLIIHGINIIKEAKIKFDKEQ